MAQMGLQKLDTNLAVQGIGPFELPQAQTDDNVGGDNTVVSEACGVLLDKAKKMTEFKEELEASKTSLLDGTWTGQAADDFAAAFPGMTTAFENIAPCIQSMAEWAQTTMDAYKAEDQAAAGLLASVLGAAGMRGESMGAIFEGSGNGSAIVQDTALVNSKAIALYDLVDAIKTEVLEIDAEIQTLALNGIKGSAMTTAVNTYVANREVLDDFVKRFAATACILNENAIAHSNINEEAQTAASGAV